MNPVRVYGIILRHFFLATHQLERVFDAFFLPLLSLIMFGFLANYVSLFQSPNLASFLVGGVILWMIFERVGSDIGVNFMYEVWDRNIINVLASPITFLEFMTGLVVIGIIKILISFSAMCLIAALFYDFNLFSLGIGLAAIWVNILFFAISFGIFNISLVVRFGNSIGPLTWILPFALQPFSAAFYPITILPEFLQKIAYMTPLSYLFEGMRQLIGTQQFNFNYFMMALGLNLIYFLASILFFSYIFRVVRRSGRLVKIN